MKTLPVELKRQLLAKKVGELIRQAETPKPRVMPTKPALVLPEDFTGIDMKKYKRIVKK